MLIILFFETITLFKTKILEVILEKKKIDKMTIDRKKI